MALQLPYSEALVYSRSSRSRPLTRMQPFTYLNRTASGLCPHPRVTARLMGPTSCRPEPAAQLRVAEAHFPACEGRVLFACLDAGGGSP